MITLTFPDGARRDYPHAITGADVAKSISPSRRVIAQIARSSVDLPAPLPPMMPRTSP